MNIANFLTIFRFLAAGMAVLLLVFCDHNSLPMIYGLVILCGLSELSDGFDGHFARKYGTVSDFGKLMDPYADSIFRMTIFFGFVQMGWCPLWMPLVMFYRDMGVSALRTFAVKNNVVLAARGSGKIKAIIQATCMISALVLALIFYKDFDRIRADIHYLVLIAALTTIWSGIDYIWANRKLFNSK